MRIVFTDHFARVFKRLSKKYPSLIQDLRQLLAVLEENPLLGTPLGKNAFKIRLAISSKNRGKSGGARVITHVRLVQETLYLITIYDKSEQTDIADEELHFLIDSIED
jgi:hypothetical protein